MFLHSKEEIMFMNEQSQPSEKGMKKIYVLLTYTHTSFAKVTKFLLDQPYTHCSIALDKFLTQLYSFNLSQNGFVKEDIKKDKVLNNSNYSLYSITVTQEMYDKIKAKIEDMDAHRENYKYNSKGLIRLFLKKPKPSEERYFCSEFVARILEMANSDLFHKSSSLVVPYDFAKNKNFHFETRGILKNYNPNKIKE